MPVFPQAALFERRPQHRALAACLGASLLLHAMLLVLLPQSRIRAERANATLTITARFAAPAAQPETPVTEQRPAPNPPSPIARPRREARIETPRQPMMQPPEQSASPLPPPATAEPSANLPPSEAVSPPASPSPPAVATPRASDAQAPSPPSQAAETADSGTLEKYRLDLIMAARRYKRYPSQAMERGWQGKVEIRLLIGANGMIRTASVRTSSGYQLLDDQAMDMIRKAKPLAQIPPVLRGREFSVDIPVIFDLQNG
jgi:protein TonB